jgi:hypothetical protein
MNELVLANRAADWRRLKMLVLDIPFDWQEEGKRVDLISRRGSCNAGDILRPDWDLAWARIVMGDPPPPAGSGFLC